MISHIESIGMQTLKEITSLKLLAGEHKQGKFNKKLQRIII